MSAQHAEAQLRRFADWRARFWSRIRKTPTCWLWTGKIHRATNYGVMRVERRDQYVHRIAWFLSHGKEAQWPPKSLQVCHRCDVRNCVRGEHLFLGTLADNMADKVAKGRQAKGEAHPLTKLTAAKVAEMRIRHAHGASFKALAREFGVNADTATKAIRRETWWQVP